MMNKRFGYLCALSLFFICGCLTLDSENKIKTKEAIQEKIKKFETLQDNVLSNTLQAGMPVQKVKEFYGDPDDVFSSGTSTGRFEIWTYEEISAKNKPTGNPIRLYINNGKLVSWNY